MLGLKLVRRLMTEYGISENLARIADSYHEGMANGDISRRFGITPGATSGRLNMVKRRLGLGSKEELLQMLRALDPG